MAPVFLAVDEQIDEEPMVVEFADFPGLTHDDATSDVGENYEMISIIENTTVTEMLKEAPINQNAVKPSRLEKVIGKITNNIDYSINFNQCVIFYCYFWNIH